MNNELQKKETRSFIRLLAAISCPFFFFAAIITAFPQVIGGDSKPSIVLALLLAGGGILFASIAATGKLNR